MHLHGHKFWVLGTGTGRFNYSTIADVPHSMVNTLNPPYRDTVDLPASGWAVIRCVFRHHTSTTHTQLTSEPDTSQIIEGHGSSTVTYNGISL